MRGTRGVPQRARRGAPRDRGHVPLVLLILVGIFEFGRAYQTWQVLTHAARAGARVAAAGSSDQQVESAVRERLQAGRLPERRDGAGDAQPAGAGGAATGSRDHDSVIRSISSCSTRPRISSGRPPPLARRGPCPRSPPCGTKARGRPCATESSPFSPSPCLPEADSAYGTYNMMQTPAPATAKMPTQPVVVAAADIPLGAELKADRLKVRQLPGRPGA